MRWDGYASWQRLGGAVLFSLVLVATVVIGSRTLTFSDRYQSATVALRAQFAVADARDFRPEAEDFVFDPNVVSKDDLLRLGLSARQANSFLKFRGKRTNAFRKPNDLRKLYALDDALKDRLVGLARVENVKNTYVRSRSLSGVQSFRFAPNAVTITELERLGLRPYQAKAWITYRTKVPGGIATARQLNKLRFLDPALKSRLLALADFPELPPPSLAAEFPFDPNTISLDSLQLLGFPEYQAKGLLHYRAGRPITFRKPEDLRRVKSLDSILVELALPLIDIAPPPPGSALPIRIGTAPTVYTRAPLPALASVDLNAADTTLLKTLPGIGSYRARRLIRYRDVLGGFYDLEQAATTRGIPDSTWQTILPYLALGPIYRQLSVNRATVEELRRHPNINSKLANTVVRFREKHGAFRSPEDLRQIRSLNDYTLAKIVPYLSFE